MKMQPLTDDAVADLIDKHAPNMFHKKSELVALIRATERIYADSVPVHEAHCFGLAVTKQEGECLMYDEPRTYSDALRVIYEMYDKEALLNKQIVKLKESLKRARAKAKTK